MPDPEHRAWRTLTPEQLRLAREINRRADRLLAESDGGLSHAEAIELAAVQLDLARSDAP